MILQLSPTIPLETPKGKGWAHFIFEHGDEHHIQWHVAIDETGEWWTFENPEVRIQLNWTMGRRKPTTLPTVSTDNPFQHGVAICGRCKQTFDPAFTHRCHDLVMAEIGKTQGT